MKVTADIAVIGGGIAGISSAAQMAGDAEVVLLEAEPAIGYHATGRSAATYIRNYGNATLRALNAVSEPALREPEGVAETSLLSPRGLLMIAPSEQVGALDEYLQGAVGMERVDPEDAVRMVPILDRSRLAKAAYEAEASDIDVDRLLQGLARLLHRRGSRIDTGAAVRRVTRRDGIWIVQTARGSVEAPVIVNAAGAWADEIARMAGVAPAGLVPRRRSAALLPAPEGHDVSSWPLFVTAAETFYAKPEAGKLMVSPADADPVEPHDAWADDMVLAEGLHRFEQAVTVAVTRVEHSWAGLRTFAADASPVVGFAPGAEGFLWLAGQGGYGVQTSPALAALAADLVAGRSPALAPEIVAALAPGRLSACADRAG